MKLYLASYLESENFGTGKKYSIAKTKPEDFSTEGVLKYLTPKDEIMENYYNKQLIDQVEAAKDFNEQFSKQLNDFVKEIKNIAKTENKQVLNVLPLKNGDTLLSWEREAYTNYRPMIAKALKKLGYEINLR
jgi:hypothetical protein